jgi:hypothetical protein
LGRQLPGSEFDMESLISRIAHGHSLERLPYRRRTSLRAGGQILVDLSDAMIPYRRDQEWLAGKLRRILGPDRVDILAFEDCPGRGAGKEPFGGWTNYRVPPAGTPVLVLTDLGIADPPDVVASADADEWLAFAHRMTDAGCMLLARLRGFAEENADFGPVA